MLRKSSIELLGNILYVSCMPTRHFKALIVAVIFPKTPNESNLWLPNSA